MNGKNTVLSSEFCFGSEFRLRIFYPESKNEHVVPILNEIKTRLPLTFGLDNEFATRTLYCRHIINFVAPPHDYI